MKKANVTNAARKAILRAAFLGKWRLYSSYMMRNAIIEAKGE
jgi:hypothetical protein